APDQTPPRLVRGRVRTCGQAQTRHLTQETETTVNDDPSAQPNLDLTDPGLDDRDLTDPDIDRPTDRPDLDHLRPDRIRIGSVGVFAGDWAWTPDAAGAMRIPVGFVGTLIDRSFRIMKIVDIGLRTRGAGLPHLSTRAHR